MLDLFNKTSLSILFNFIIILLLILIPINNYQFHFVKKQKIKILKKKFFLNSLNLTPYPKR